MIRYLHQAQAEFETHLFNTINDDISIEMKRKFDQWLDHNNDTQALLIFKQSLSTLTPEAIVNFIEKRNALDALNLSESTFSVYHRKLLLKYHQRIMIETPAEIITHPANNRYAMLAIFCYVQQSAMTDTLGQVSVDLGHKLKIKAETFVKKKILSEVACVKGKFDILYRLANLSAENPKGTIGDTIYPSVDQDTLQTLAKELEHRGNWYEKTVKVKMRAYYTQRRSRCELAVFKLSDAHIFSG